MDGQLQEFDFRERGIRVTGRVAGGGEPVFVFLHGFPDFWGSFPDLARLINPGGQNIFLDLPGYGKNGGAENADAYRLSAAASGIGLLVNALSLRNVTYVGHDWGAAVGWLLWMGGAPRISRYIAMNAPHPAAFFASMREGPQWEMSAYARRLSETGAHEGLDAGDLASWSNDAKHNRELKTALEKSSALAMVGYYRQNYPQERNYRLGAMPRGNKAFLLIYSDDDPFIHAHTYAASMKHGGERLTISAIDGGHFIHRTRTEVVAVIIRQWIANA